MNCYVHNEHLSVGTCISCGKFICSTCNTEVNSKNYCKRCIGEIVTENNRKIENLENHNKNQPMVFMNAGGGGGGSSSSSSSSSSSGIGGGFHTSYTKSRTTAGILALILGGLGVHKFYLGKWGLGLLYLLFCWTYIPSVIAFVEGIMYLVSSDENFAKKHDSGYRLIDKRIS